MNGRFRVLLTAGFERDFLRISRRNPALEKALEDMLAILREDPGNRTGRHPIKKLAGVKTGEGPWRIRWRKYRVRYDLIGTDVLLYSFRHRKDAY
jgi:mRNA-degrading endonuclease RelE of RelBE toxin-antitoxin system